ALDAKRLSFAGTPTECHNAAFAPGKPATAAVRQHDIRLLAANQAAPGANALTRTVVRHVFLGASRDYIVEVGGGVPLRITAAPEADFASGSRVGLLLP